MENLWNEVHYCIRMSQNKPTYKKDLWEKLQEIWYNIEVDIMIELIMSMLQRVKDVYQAKGGYT